MDEVQAGAHELEEIAERIDHRLDEMRHKRMEGLEGRLREMRDAEVSPPRQSGLAVDD